MKVCVSAVAMLRALGVKSMPWQNCLHASDSSNTRLEIIMAAPSYTAGKQNALRKFLTKCPVLVASSATFPWLIPNRQGVVRLR